MVRGDPLVAHDDLELFLTGWYRTVLAERPEEVCQRAKVDKREPKPGTPFPDVLVVIRDDSGPELSILTAERQVGINVFCTRERDAVDLARIVHALRSQLPAVEPGNPVAAVTGSTGPYEVPEPQPRFRRYMTVTLIVAGSPL